MNTENKGVTPRLQIEVDSKGDSGESWRKRKSEFCLNVILAHLSIESRRFSGKEDREKREVGHLGVQEAGRGKVCQV